MEKMMMDTINKQAEIIEKALTLNQMEHEEKIKFLESPEWKELVEKAKRTQLRSYTVCYRDTDGAVKKAWHHIAENNIDYIKEKYKKQGKDIMYFVLKEEEE